MPITVEFFGIPRARAGVERTTVLDGRESATLEEVLCEVATSYPEFASACMTSDHTLRDGYIVSVDGQCFVHDGVARIAGDQSVLILSADAGG